MIKVLEDCIPFSSFVNQPEEDIIKAFQELPPDIQASASLAENNIELVYETVLTGLFGHVRGLEVKDSYTGEIIKVSRKSLKELYKPLKLKSQVFKAVVGAHNSILETGFKTGNEMVIAIDIDTGVIYRSKIGSPDYVKWSIGADCPRRLLTIHNHSDTLTFSDNDMDGFNRVRQKEMMVVQCHDGSLYGMLKLNPVRFALGLDDFQAVFAAVTKDNKEMSLMERCEICVQRIVGKTKWVYMKGD